MIRLSRCGSQSYISETHFGYRVGFYIWVLDFYIEFARPNHKTVELRAYQSDASRVRAWP